MIGTFITMNIRVAWRNLMKYKLQNLISSLCLAVGIICFTIAFYFAGEIFYSYNLRNKYVAKIAFEETEEDGRTHSTDANETRTIINQLRQQKLNTVKEILYHDRIGNLPEEHTVKSPEGKEYQMPADVYGINPGYLNAFQYRSAINGKRIKRLKPGELLITDELSEQLFGKGFDPRGYELMTPIEGTTHVISDVVNTRRHMTHRHWTHMSELILVTDNDPATEEHFDMEVELNEGATSQELRKELLSLYPQYGLFIEAEAEKSYTIYITSLLLTIGGCVLVIGLLGFLKMELQIFTLRQRELGLRRCVGAQASQLFWLLASEIAIVFVFTALLSYGISATLAPYAQPIVNRPDLFPINFDIPTIYAHQGWIILGTLLVTLFISYLSVRRVLHTPLGMTVGKSTRRKGAGHTLMLVGQTTVCMFFVALVCLAYFNIYKIRDGLISTNTVDVDKSKDCMVLDASELNATFINELSRQKDIREYGLMQRVNFYEEENFDSTEVRKYVTFTHDGNAKGYFYTVALITDGMLEQLGMQVSPTFPKEGIGFYSRFLPVYTRTIYPGKAIGKEVILPIDGKTYKCLGYIGSMPQLPIGIYQPTMFIVVPRQNTTRLSDCMGEMPHFSNELPTELLIFSHKHHYNKVLDQLTKLKKETIPEKLKPLNAKNAYEEWFREHRMYDLAKQLSLLLACVSLLCIVLTVFSSISIETKGRQKEVAIRKVHGAQTRQILWLFLRYYLYVLFVSAIIAIPCTIYINSLLHVLNVVIALSSIVFSILVVSFVTLFTVWFKISQIAHTNAADVIKRE